MIHVLLPLLTGTVKGIVKELENVEVENSDSTD